MFRRDIHDVSELVNAFLRQNGLETPLLQRRLIDSWGKVAGKTIERYTEEKYIRNQVLFVKLSRPALRADLSMMRTELVNRLNQEVGAKIIIDIRFY
jgi:predicted nucleic acid-binding Zn ribbon protein